MIPETQIRQLVLEKIEGTNQFLVEAKVAAGNKINVMVDSPDGMPIKAVVEISRHIEGSFDREKEDFELTVSSPGLDLPFKVLQQYLKYIGKEVEVKAGNGKKVQGILLSADEEGIVVETSEKKKIEGKKKKELVVTQHVFKFESTELSQKINECKVVITF
ncbi:MAG: ribosome assembly cofactor RimP [Flavobacteriales bacterium]